MQGDQGILTTLKTIFPCLATYSYAHTHISFRRSTNSVTQHSDMKLIRKKTNNTQQKQTNTIQYNKQMSVLQSPKSNTVHNIIIK